MGKVETFPDLSTAVNILCKLLLCVPCPLCQSFHHWKEDDQDDRLFLPKEEVTHTYEEFHEELQTYSKAQ